MTVSARRIVSLLQTKTPPRPWELRRLKCPSRASVDTWVRLVRASANRETARRVPGATRPSEQSVRGPMDGGTGDASCSVPGMRDRFAEPLPRAVVLPSVSLWDFRKPSADVAQAQSRSIGLA